MSGAVVLGKRKLAMLDRLGPLDEQPKKRGRPRGKHDPARKRSRLDAHAAAMRARVRPKQGSSQWAGMTPEERRIETMRRFRKRAS